MANEEHLAILEQGVVEWNKWREKHPEIWPHLRGIFLEGASLAEVNFFHAFLEETDLTEADLRGANLQEAQLSRADLRWVHLDSAHLEGADLSEVDLFQAQLPGAHMEGARLNGANLTKANLFGAHLEGAQLNGANLTEANLFKADLNGASLMRALLVETNLEKANLTGCSIYGISAWRLKLDGSRQTNLVITDSGPDVTVDNLEVAQFVYLMLNNKKIRDVIDTIGAKGVLILGRFIEERKAVLDAIRNKLRELDFVPMMFDFEKSTQRDFTETIKTLAGMSRFIIADITNPKSSPLELQAIMPDYMIPFVPIIQEGEEPFAMFQDLNQKYGEWTLDLLEYDSTENLIGVLKEAVVMPSLKLADKLIDKKAGAIRKRHVKDFN
jgi:uncharacterized protein YjbI with pentapeptide repeats